MLRMTTDSTTWTNWAGNVSSHPLRTVAPHSSLEISQLVVQAGQHENRIKMVGSGHSFTAIAQTEGILLRPDQLTGIVWVDSESMHVRVRAGTPLFVLNPILASLGFALENLGDIDRQTVSGAIATGTHGTGATFKGLAHSVVSFQMVLANGEIVECNESENSQIFSAGRVGLGAFGIITEVTLQCIPHFFLTAREEPGTLAETLTDLEELVDRIDHFEFYWFPHTNNVLLKKNTRVTQEMAGKPLPRWRAWLDDEFLSNNVFEVINRLAAKRPKSIPRINQLSSRVLSAREYTSASHEVFASPRKVVFREMEYAIPRAAAQEALNELTSMIERLRLNISFPVEVRFTAADDIWLSTAFERESCYIAIHQYHRMDHVKYFREFEAIARSFDGRPHWGKIHNLTSAELTEIYPMFVYAQEIRNSVDPERIFTNAYLDRVLGP